MATSPIDLSSGLQPKQGQIDLSAGFKEAPPAPEPTTMQKVGSAASDLGKGLLKGAGSTLSNIDEGVAKIPYIGKALTTPLIGSGTSESARQQLKDATVPQNTTQAIGKGIEQAGEFLIPGAGEEKLGATLAEHAPQLGKLAAPLARTVSSGLSAGVVNKAQGGDFKTGAEGGLIGGGIGEGMRAAAPMLAESALGIRNVDRRYGRTPGQAVIEDTKGVRPGTVAESAQSKLGELTPQLETAAANSPNTGSLIPARNVVSEAQGTAARRGALVSHGQLQPLNDALTGNQVTHTLYPQDVPALQLLDIKRGIGDDFIHNWNPESTSATIGTGKQAYRALNDEFHGAVPEAQDLDQRISSLIPVATRATAKDTNAGLGQRVLGRIGAHTGALAGAGLGASLGGYSGGPEGAIKGGLLGLIAPEVLASPTTQMIGARTLAHPGPLLKLGTGSALQLDRKGNDANH